MEQTGQRLIQRGPRGRRSEAPESAKPSGGEGLGRSSYLSGLSYEEAEQHLRPIRVRPPDGASTLDRRRDEILDTLLMVAIHSHPATTNLFEAEDRERRKRGGWESRGTAVNYLHDETDAAILIPRGSQRQLEDLIHRKAVLAIYGYAWNSVCVELARVENPEVLADTEGWKRQVHRLYNTLLDRYLEETVLYYREHVGDRGAWRRQAPFLRAPALCPL